jgi:hypothetical protein
VKLRALAHVAEAWKMAAREKPHVRADRRHRGQGPMDQRIESFLADVLALAGEAPDAIREGVRVDLAKCDAIFRLREARGA